MAEQCPARGRRGEVCYLISEHPGPVHLDLSEGWHKPFSLPNADTWGNVYSVPSDPLQDAPEALKGG